MERKPLTFAVPLIAALLVPATAHAQERRQPLLRERAESWGRQAPALAQSAPTVTVMTRNVFLGADLAPAIGAPNIAQAIDGAGTVWNEFQSTKFPERAVPLAREIKQS